MEEQIAQAGEEELADGYEKSVNAQCDQLKLVVSNIKKCLEEINRIKTLNTVDTKNKKRVQRHLSKLNEMYETHWDKDLIYNKQLIQLITDLYFYTEEFFSLKGVITQPIFLMTAVDDKNGLFLRKEFKQDLMQEAEKFLSLSRSGHKMSDESYRVALRFNTKTVMEQMIDAIKDNEAEKKVAKNLYSHYEEFCKPFFEWDQRVNGKTDTRINKGVCREAFEVHLENMHNELQLTPTQFKNCNMPSEGIRWILYRRASGSDPYFTGPDTNLSQVKSENASLISNIDTILNIAKFIIEQGEALSIEELKNIVKTKNKEEIRSFSKQFWETTSQEVQNQIIKELEGSVVNRKYTVLIK